MNTKTNWVDNETLINSVYTLFVGGFILGKQIHNDKQKNQD